MPLPSQILHSMHIIFAAKAVYVLCVFIFLASTSFGFYVDEPAQLIALVLFIGLRSNDFLQNSKQFFSSSDFRPPKKTKNKILATNNDTENISPNRFANSTLPAVLSIPFHSRTFSSPLTPRTLIP